MNSIAQNCFGGSDGNTLDRQTLSGKYSPFEFSRILDSLVQAVRIINLDYTVRYVNPAFTVLTCCPKDQIIGRKCWEVFGNPACHTADCVLARIMAGETRVEMELERSRIDGTTVLCISSAFPLYTPDGHIIGIFESLRDSTRRKELQTRLEESENRYRALVELGAEVGEAIIMLQDIDGRDGIQVFVNDEWPKITGYSKDELTGMSFFDLVSQRYRKYSRERHRKKMAGKTIPGLFEIEIVHKNGSVIPAELTSAFTNYNGSKANVLYVRDITQRKKMERVLKCSELQMRSLSRRMITAQEAERTMLSRELHAQFGQELVALRFEALNLADKLPANAEPETANRMVNSLDKLIDMVHNLSCHLRPGILDDLGLVKALQCCAENFERRTGISCPLNTNGFSSDLLTIERDTATVVYRIVQEALANVLRHSKATQARIELELKNGNLVVSIIDNGAGINNKRYSKRMPLGLMGMRERASIVGGTLRIKSRLNNGTSVIVSLPCCDSNLDLRRERQINPRHL